MNEQMLNEWWYMHCDLSDLEKATGYSRWDYEPDDSFQDFVDACDAWWLTLTLAQQKNVYRKLNG